MAMSRLSMLMYGMSVAARNMMHLCVVGSGLTGSCNTTNYEAAYIC